MAIFFFTYVSLMIIPCHQQCQFFGSKTYLKIIFKIFALIVPKSESLRLIEQTVGMKEAETCTAEALRDTRSAVKYLHLGSTSLSGS